MRLSIAAVAVCIASAQAFKDTSPFLLFSSSPLPSFLKDISQDQLETYKSVEKTTKAFLNECPSEIYYLISQPSLSSTDLNTETSAPFLKRALSNPAVRSRYAVSEVLGQDAGSADELAAYIKSHCGAIELDEQEMRTFDPRAKMERGRGVIVRMTMEELSLNAGERKECLADNDAKIYNNLLKDLSTGPKYTVILTTTPVSAPIVEEYTYESSFSAEEAVHIDLKRDLRMRIPPKTENTDLRPLFEKYQFLTPGIFMGLLVGTILLSILGVGIKAVSSLQVSYAAFEKEMGPAAQKKQQ